MFDSPRSLTPSSRSSRTSRRIRWIRSLPRRPPLRRRRLLPRLRCVTSEQVHRDCKLKRGDTIPLEHARKGCASTPHHNTSSNPPPLRRQAKADAAAAAAAKAAAPAPAPDAPKPAAPKPAAPKAAAPKPAADGDAPKPAAPKPAAPKPKAAAPDAAAPGKAPAKPAAKVCFPARVLFWKPFGGHRDYLCALSLDLAACAHQNRLAIARVWPLLC